MSSPTQDRKLAPALAVFTIAMAAAFVLGGYELLRSPTNTLYVKAYGKENLPMVMAFIPLSVFACVFAYGRILSALGPRKTLMVTTLGSAAIVGICQFLADQGLAPATAVLWLFRNAYVVIIIEQYWSFINSVLDEKKAAKYNGPICGVASIGSVAGASIGAALAVKFGSASMIYLSALMTLPAAFVSNVAYRRAGEPLDTPKTPPRGAFQHLGLGQFKSYPILILIFAIVAATQVVAGVLAIAWQGVLSDTYTNVDMQTEFSYSFYAWINGIAAVLQFIAAPFVMRYFNSGIVNVLIPTAQMVAIVVYLRDPTLATVSLAYMIFKCLDYSIFRASKEALYIPLPFDARFRAKEVIDVFGYRFSKGITAGLIALVQRAGFVFRDTTYAVVALAALGVWALLAVPLAIPREDDEDDPGNLDAAAS